MIEEYIEHDEEALLAWIKEKEEQKQEEEEFYLYTYGEDYV
jgi:hypothetical protein